MKNPTDPEGDEPLRLLSHHASEFFLDGWLVMLAFGVAHGSAKGVPAFGYWQSAFMAWVVAGLASTGNLGLTARVKKLAKMV